MYVNHPSKLCLGDYTFAKHRNKFRLITIDGALSRVCCRSHLWEVTLNTGVNFAFLTPHLSFVLPFSPALIARLLSLPAVTRWHRVGFLKNFIAATSDEEVRIGRRERDVCVGVCVCVVAFTKKRNGC